MAFFATIPPPAQPVDEEDSSPSDQYSASHQTVICGPRILVARLEAESRLTAVN